jgi:hypothetical protein
MDTGDTIGRQDTGQAPWIEKTLAFRDNRTHTLEYSRVQDRSFGPMRTNRTTGSPRKKRHAASHETSRPAEKRSQVRAEKADGAFHFPEAVSKPLREVDSPRRFYNRF